MIPKSRVCSQLRMRRRNVAGLGLLLAVAATPLYLGMGAQDAFAQPGSAAQYGQCTKTVTPQESDLAHQKYIAGKQDYDEGNYESAIRRFRDAYNLDCQKHELLIIISAAYERNLDKKEAIAALEAYVQRAPTAPDLETYRTKIANMKKELAKAPPPTASTSAPPPPPPSSDTQEHTIYPWIVVGVGGAAAIAGVISLALAPDIPAGCDEETKKCVYIDPNVVDQPTQPGQRAPSQEQRDDLLSRQNTAGRAVTMPTVGVVLLAAGGALIVGGLIWHFLEPTGPKEGASPPATGKVRLKPRPAIAPGFAGLSLGGTF
jgi:hypothetical protein